MMPQELESTGLASLTAEEKVAALPMLLERAPGADALEKRQWVAAQLVLPVRVVNRLLWRHHRIRWDPVPAKNPRGYCTKWKGRVRTTDPVPAGRRLEKRAQEEPLPQLPDLELPELELPKVPSWFSRDYNGSKE